TPVDEEITSLYDNLSDETKNSILPKLKSDYTVTFQSNKERLQPKDMTTYNKTKGKESYKALAKLFRTDEYKTASNEEQSKMVANVFEKSGKLAKIDTLLSKGKDEWKVYTDDFSGGKANYASAKKAGISAKDYYTAFDGADKDDNGSVSQYEAYKKLEKTKFTKEQKAVLWAKFNKSWASKNNPYLGGKIPSSGKSGSSGSSSGSSKKSSSSTSSTTGLATKQVNSLKNLDLTTNTLSKSELKAMIKMLLQ
ncbi:MAG: hypothetical protein LLG05_01145, partial [Porphyromonadaceae bacterium]|nr:hypothetical protein [Porphyromonadaceae bacterium]